MRSFLRPLVLSAPLLRAIAGGTTLAGAALAGVSLGGCSVLEFPAQSRGTQFDPEEVRQLVPGTSTRADAAALLGTPTTRATFDDDTWVYIDQTTRPRVGRVVGVEKQKVLVLRFDQGGTLRDMRQLTKADAEPAPMVARVTPSPGSEASFLQQILGNVGRYSPGGLGGVGGSGVGNTGGGLTTH